MASLRDAVNNNINELREGIPWVVFWREGRSWNSEAVFFSFEYAADTLDPYDMARLEQINSTDPRAVALNSYYCGHLGEDMTLDELTRGVRWHYENGYNTLAGFIEEHNPALPPEVLEEARQAAHAVGLPFSERPYNGRELDPYVYDGSMTPEDYEKRYSMIEQERSETMTDTLSIQIHNRTLFENGEPGEWLKLPATAEQLHTAMERVGITSDNPQDFFINGIESPIEAVRRLPFEQIQAATVDELNYLAAKLEALDPEDIKTLNAASEVIGYWDDVHHLTEYANNPEFFVLISAYNNIQLGEHYLNSEMIQMPDEWIGAINIEMLGQLAAEHEKGQFTEQGYIVESGDTWEPVNEVPEQYRIMGFPQQEQPNRDTPEVFAQDFSQTMQEFYKGHTNYLETTQMANTSTSFIAHQIEIGHTVAYLDGALNALEADPAYSETALTFRQRLEALKPPLQNRDIPHIDYDTISTRAPAVATVQPPEQAQPQPVIPIVLTSENPAEKLKEITDRLEKGIADIFESEQYQTYLNTLSKFHNYSLNNTILIAMQKPDASHVAGFTSWKNQFQRNVRKGEKGIKILAPSPFKIKKEMEKIDPTTQRPIVGADGKPVTEEQEVTIPAFKVVSVFDVSQTEGKELPNIGVDILTGSVEQYQDFFAALEKTSPVPIALENIEGGANGYYHLEDKRIAVKEGMSELQTLKTTIHEIAHARLHDIDLNAPKDEQSRVDRRTREVQAESIAYTVCQHYELDTSDYSFGYVAGWSSGKELTELKASLETIRTAAAELITEIDGHFAELQKGREQTAEQDVQTHEPPAPEQSESVYNRLPPEQQQALSNEVKATLQFFIDGDIKERGELSDGTLEAIAVQGYEYRDGQLEKAAMPEHQQPGVEEWSEPATTENAPENPGIPSDDIGAYLPPQDEQTAQTGDEPQAAVTYYPINETAARRAKEMNSFYDYKPGSATAEYRQSVDEAAGIAARQKSRVDPMYHEKIDSLLDTYARKLAENMNNSFSIESRVPSVMIAGPANFPVRKKEKQNAARDKNMEEWQDIRGLLDKIRGTGMGGISADDPNAVSKLTSKLAGLEKAQENMKAANAYYRKHKTLDGCPVLSPEQIQKLTADMANRWYGRAARQPFEAYSLQNNNAEINRLKNRIEGLQKHEVIQYAGWEFDGGKVEANKQDNRLQIFFDGKPDESTRAELKQNGFKWAPSVGAWQRQLNNNAFFACNYIKSIQPLTGEKPTDLQRKARQEVAAPVQQSGQDTQEQHRTEPQQDTYCIYQLKQGDETRDFRFEPFDRLQKRGLAALPKNYELVYTAPMGADTGSLERIFEKFNIDHPEDFTGHSLSVSDIVTLNHDGSETAHYVDSFGFKEVPEFLQQQDLDAQQTAEEPTTPDNALTGKKIQTPRGSFSLTDMTVEQMNAAGYGFHHSSDDGKYNIMANGMRAFAIVNPLRTAEMSAEQNYNMIDGIHNNAPSVSELEARAKAGEQINLSDLAAAIKADKAAERDGSDKKPSIREQLKSGKGQTERSKPAPDKSRDKSPDLEV